MTLLLEPCQCFKVTAEECAIPIQEEGPVAAPPRYTEIEDKDVPGNTTY